MQLNHKKESGFTLIEMAMSLLILSLAVAMFLPAYTKYTDQLKIIQNEEHFTEARLALETFIATNGFYPAPAPLTAPRNSPSYGRSDNNPLPAAGTCVNGICAQNSNRGAGFEVRVGTIPFKTLNIDEQFAYDGFDNRFTYAVTDSLTNSATFNANMGGISIVNAGLATVIEPADSAHFILVSHGPNGNGAYNKDGVQAPCNLGTPESDNCNISILDNIANYVYTDVSTSIAAGNLYDDILTYNLQDSVPLWTFSSSTDPSFANTIELKGNSLTLGPNDVLLTSISGDTQELHAEASIRANSAIRLENICSTADPTAAGCFNLNKVAGDPIPGVPGNLACPGGQFLVGIDAGEPICEAVIEKRCPANNYLQRINPDGSFVCIPFPAPGCPGRNFTLCAGTSAETVVSVPDGIQGQEILSSVVGDTHKSRFRCRRENWINPLVWEIKNSSGNCVCNASDDTVISLCPDGLTNALSTRTVVTCGASGTTTITRNYSGCPCAGTDIIIPEMCPAGFVSSHPSIDIIKTRTFTGCSVITGAPLYGPPIVTTNNCVCSPDVIPSWQSCPTGYNAPGSTGIKLETTLSCASGSPVWTGPTEVNRNCICQVGFKDTRERSCPAGQVGKIHEENELICGSGYVGWTETATSPGCSPVIIDYRWRDIADQGRRGPLTSNAINNACSAAQNSATTGIGGTPVDCHDPNTIAGGSAQRFTCTCNIVP